MRPRCISTSRIAAEPPCVTVSGPYLSPKYGFGPPATATGALPPYPWEWAGRVAVGEGPEAGILGLKDLRDSFFEHADLVREPFLCGELSQPTGRLVQVFEG